MAKNVLYSFFLFCCVVYGIAAQDCNSEVGTCVQILPQSSDISKSCSIFQRLKTCLNSTKDKCSSTAIYQSIKTSLDNFELLCVNTKTSSVVASADDSDPGVTGSCAEVASRCFQTVSNVSDQTKVCANYLQFKSCWEPLKVKCGDDEIFASMQSNIANLEKVCKIGDCGQLVISECSNVGQGFDILPTNWTSGVLSELCKKADIIQQKCITKVESCPSLQDFLKQYDVDFQQSFNAVRQVRKLCANQKPILSKYSSCLGNEDVSVKINQCGEIIDDMSAIDQKDSAVPMCQRLENVKACIQTVIAESCDENAAAVISPIISHFMKSAFGNADLDCPSNTAAGQRSNQMMFGIVLAILFVFLYMYNVV